MVPQNLRVPVRDRHRLITDESHIQDRQKFSDIDPDRKELNREKKSGGEFYPKKKAAKWLTSKHALNWLHNSDYTLASKSV